MGPSHLITPSFSDSSALNLLPTSLPSCLFVARERSGPNPIGTPAAPSQASITGPAYPDTRRIASHRSMSSASRQISSLVAFGKPAVRYGVHPCLRHHASPQLPSTGNDNVAGNTQRQLRLGSFEPQTRSFLPEHKTFDEGMEQIPHPRRSERRKRGKKEEEKEKTKSREKE
ncbi:hypothetical protein BO70DRAFT_202898 [Aspergillus heteromorphus CBS 117.55]|uniref:Uncharacterized protein n=1 Tax=Aspergillus heteromorphus CBS 117.55 TaxID=1448321 RepID=A0A317WRK9_9EURO|nr:uncharacterized protein BO70DRAFT_202898 [Aspergillus heteromorphus CBS 117.55]PWY87767.1 hypothetical protein BO70DRAFT_202898 [Aspergillus heteromorphus CBS 117.55]